MSNDQLLSYQLEADLKKATGASDLKRHSVNRLNRIIQLTGFSDPVYAEAYVDVHQYDILLGRPDVF